MPSSKGKPTDPKLREKVKEDVMNETNKDGTGKGQMAAWKAGKIAREYEKEGGSYENEPGSENKPKQGAPEAKSDAEKMAETQKDDKPKANSGKKAATKKGDGKAKTPRNKKEPRKGTRSSARIASQNSNKRKAPEPEKKPAAKKAKTSKK